MKLVTKQLKNFFICSFLGSWIIWSMAVLKSYEIINISISNETLNHFGSYAPSVAAIIFHTTSNLSLGLSPIFSTLHGGVSILFFLLLVTSIITILNKDIMFNKQEIYYLHN